MAIITNEFTHYDAVGAREILDNIITDISPEKTPFSSLIGQRSVDGVYFETQTDALAAASTTNAQLEGDNVTSYSAITPTTRHGNYCQISRKTFVITRTQDAELKAGRGSEVARQKVRKGAELKRDIEATLLDNIAQVSGGTGTARKTGTMGSWIASNTDKGTGGGDPTGDGTDARTDSTSTNQRAFTETILKSVMQSCWTAGAEPSYLMVGPHNKTVVSGFGGIGALTVNVGDRAPAAAILATADVYQSDFGKLNVVANRLQRDRDAWFIDPRYAKKAVFEPFMAREMPESVDGFAYMVLTEWGLSMANEAAFGLAADLTTS